MTEIILELRAKVHTKWRKINDILHPIAILRQLLFDVLWKSDVRAMNSNKLSKWFNITINKRVMHDSNAKKKQQSNRDKVRQRTNKQTKTFNGRTIMRMKCNECIVQGVVGDNRATVKQNKKTLDISFLQRKMEKKRVY